MDQDAIWYGGRLRPRQHCVICGPSSPHERGTAVPHFLPMCIVAKRSPILATAELLLHHAIEGLKCAGSVANFIFSTACSFVHWQHKGTKASYNVDAVQIHRRVIHIEQ